MFWEYANGFMLEVIALKAAITIPSILLQRPHRQSKLKENLCCLERRLSLWKDGSISELLLEGHSIQDRLKPSKTVYTKENNRAITFANLVMQGTIKSAIRLLDDVSGGSILHATDLCKDGKMAVHDCLAAKHPPGQPVVPFEVISTS